MRVVCGGFNLGGRSLRISIHMVIQNQHVDQNLRVRGTWMLDRHMYALQNPKCALKKTPTIHPSSQRASNRYLDSKNNGTPQINTNNNTPHQPPFVLQWLCHLRLVGGLTLTMDGHSYMIKQVRHCGERGPCQ